MKTLKNGFYTQPKTSNVIAIIDNVGYHVSRINGKLFISTERVIVNCSIVENWDFVEFKKTI